MAPADPVEEEKKDAGAKAPAAEPRPKTSLVPILVLSLVMAGAGYATAAFVLKPMFAPSGAAAPEPHEAEGPAAKGEIVSFANIIVNPSGTGGSRYLNVTVGFEVSDAATREIIEGSEPRIKDALITQLSSRSIEELTNPQTREEIRKTIGDMVNGQIAPHRVSAVYFLDFVLQ